MTEPREANDEDVEDAPVDPMAPGRSVDDDSGDAIEPNEPA